MKAFARSETEIDKVTIYDIARITGTNITAVSRAFQPGSKISAQKREKILAVAKKYGYTPNKIAGCLSRKKIKIGAVIYYNIPEFCDDIVRGIESEAEALADFKVECDLVKVKKPEDSLKILDVFRENGCDGILVGSSCDETDAKINEIVEGGIPVGLITTESVRSGRTFSITNNLDAAGRMAAEFLGYLTGGGKVAVFSGQRQSGVHAELVSAFKSEAEKTGLNIDGVYYTEDLPEKAAEISVDVLKKSDLKGIYISSANSVPIIENVIACGRQREIKIIASDVFPKLSYYMENGIVNATVFQNPFEQSRLALEKLYYLISEKAQPEDNIKIVPELVMRSNLYLYEKK